MVNHKLIDKIAPEVMAMLLHYHWPGNVRELKNVVERLVVLADDSVITAQYLPLVIKNFNQKQGDNKITANFETLTRLEEAVIEAERRTIINVLTLTGNNKAKAAKMLRIPRSTLYYKLQKLNIAYDGQIHIDDLTT
ncbi:Transcriptional regulatory protein ZraR [Pelotomaculum sp. FP]|nr:Transcriptional regulatory protein ZraR [Pelotomaculum sp. FP]